jgi:hypothetical protein
MKDTIKNWKVETVKLADVVPMPDNERYIEQRNLEGLKRCIQRFGLVELPVWNRTTGHIIAGHQRFYSLKEMDVDEVDMIVVDLTEEDEMAANLTMNNPHIQGNWTENTSDLLRDIENSDKELYQALNMDILQKEVDKLMPKVPDIMPDANFSLPEPDWNTQCPCCRHKWLIGAKDVVIEEIPSKKEENKGVLNEKV